LIPRLTAAPTAININLLEAVSMNFPLVYPETITIQNVNKNIRNPYSYGFIFGCSFVKVAKKAANTKEKEECTLDTVIGLPREIKMIAVRMPQCSPTIKMLNTRTTSSKLPRYPDNSAKARAKAPAVNVPSARLNPLLKVAPALTLILNHFLKKTDPKSI
jgi:hypothetical protein